MSDWHTTRRGLKEIKYHQTDPSTPLGSIKREWKLGKGPCGKTVVDLTATFTDQGLTIMQYCEGQREPDTFIVPLKIICSTIQMFPLN